MHTRACLHTYTRTSASEYICGRTSATKYIRAHARPYIAAYALQRARISQITQPPPLVIANPSGYPADLLATVRGRCLVFRPWCQRGCPKLPGTCLELALRGLSRIVDDSEFLLTNSDILLTILTPEFQVAQSDVLSTILSSRCQTSDVIRRF